MGDNPRLSQVLIDNLRPIGQTMALLILGVFIWWGCSSDMIEPLLKSNISGSFSILVHLLASGSKFLAIILAMAIVWYTIIRPSNRNHTFCNGNIYHDYPYWWFLFCAKFLRYKKCNLMRIPIHTQFLLVIQTVFDEFDIPDSSFPKENFEAEVVVIQNIKEKNNEYNLILEDTYPITESQLPVEKRELYTVKIKHKNKNNNLRIFNKQFVKKVCETVRSFPDGITINLYATTNPKHNYEIARQAFALGDRGNVQQLNVYQQDGKEPRKFQSYKKVYVRNK